MQYWAGHIWRKLIKGGRKLTWPIVLYSLFVPLGLLQLWKHSNMNIKKAYKVTVLEILHIESTEVSWLRMVFTLTLIPAAGCSSHVTTVNCDTVSYKVLVSVHVTQGCLTRLAVTTLGRFIAVALIQPCHKHNWGVAVVIFLIPATAAAKRQKSQKKH